VLESYGTIPFNQRYGKRINLKLNMPDQAVGFKDEYLSGTHIAIK